jgi:hypothetical protein
LVATKQLTVGRVAALNFYPPSSNVRSDFWQSSTDGGLLMANALLWAAGGIPLRIGSVTVTDSTVSFGWNGQSGQVYQVEYCTNLAAPAWSNLTGLLTNTTGAGTVSDNVTGGSQRFYRLKLVP